MPLIRLKTGLVTIDDSFYEQIYQDGNLRGKLHHLCREKLLSIYIGRIPSPLRFGTVLRAAEIKLPNTTDPEYSFLFVLFIYDDAEDEIPFEEIDEDTAAMSCPPGDIEDLDECDRIYGDNESDGQALKQLFYPNYFSNDPMERELPHRILQLLNEKESVDSIDALIKEAKGMQAVDLTGPDPTRRTIFKALQAKGLEVTPEYLDQIFPRDRTQTLN